MESLGINPVLLVAQLISFTILFLVLNRFLFPVVRKALDDRHDAIAKTFSDREEVKKQLEAFTLEQQKQQKKVVDETRKLLDEAKKSAATTREELLAQAARDSRVLVDKAQAEITKNQLAARHELAEYTKDLARQIVSKTISEKSVDPAWQKKQVAASLDTLSKSKS